MIYGGVGQSRQVRALNAGTDIVVATPGRLLDLMQQGFVDLSHVEILVLDEADRMLDMGFIHDLRRIVEKVPRRRQTLMFSATLPPAIRTLAGRWLTGSAGRPRRARHGHRADDPAVGDFCRPEAEAATAGPLAAATPWTRTLVFTRTKHGADKIAKALRKGGHPADAFHSNKSQSARQRVLLRFKAPQPLVLVATDIAARGLDIDDVSHVVNFDLPADADNYIHRIGRTGRAGAAGIAISFCDQGERSRLQAIQRVTRQTLAVEECPAGMPAERDKLLHCSARTEPGRPPAATSSLPARGKRFGNRRRGAFVRQNRSA